MIPKGIRWIFGTLVLVFLAACRADQPIKIGFAADLTGPSSALGVPMRNGAQLAVDAINAQGGIDGRPLELIVRDDMGDAAEAQSVDRQLIEMGVVGIVGHVTSAQVEAVLDLINQSEVVLISPVAASTDFSGQEDFFFRVMSSNQVLGEALARHIYQTRGIRQLTGVYDLSNRAYTETIWNAIQVEYESLGGDAAQDFTFTSGETDLRILLEEVAASQPQGVVFFASDVDTALMVQFAEITGLNAALFANPWAQTEQLLQKGGRAVEGLEMISLHNPDNERIAFQEFSANYLERFSGQPAFSAAFAYEAVWVLAEALQQTGGNSVGLSEALAGHEFNGIQGLISFDQYGDVVREAYISVVNDRQFEIINVITP